MKRTSILASAAALSLLSFVSIQACSGEDGDDEQTMQPNQPAQGGAVGAVGGSGAALGGSSGAGAAVGGSTSEGQGGTPVTGQGGNATSPTNQGGTGGAPAAQGGTGGAPAAMGGTGGAATGAPPACAEDPAPSNGVSCTVTCTDPCSIHQLGSRVCDCPGEEVCDDGQTAPCYDCGTCVPINPNDPLFAVPTGPLPDCTADDSVLEDMAGCTENDRCSSTRVNGDGVRNRFCGCRGGSWDCDSKPANFP